MRIGLIAGSGQFPAIFARKAMARGIDVYAIAYFNETDPGLEKEVAAFKWVYLGQIGRLLKFFKENDVRETVIMGAVKKTKLFTDVRPDMKIISLLARMKHTHDDAILRAFAGLLEDEGISVKPSTYLLPELLATEGCWTRRKLSRSEKADVELGWRLAREVGRLDIGQCVVVGGGSVLAVEAIEGTDAAIQRGAKFGKGAAVVVKACKPNQDFRFDVPAVGVRTIETMQAAGAVVLAVEAGKAVVFDRDEMIALADRCRIAIVGLRNEGLVKSP